jgi:hypothetical protein
MDKTIRKYATFDEMKVDEYRYWQSRPVHERVAAVSELTQNTMPRRARFKMYPDFKELLSTLNAHRVKYLLVGAYAVSTHDSHGQPKTSTFWSSLTRRTRRRFSRH